MRINTTPTDHIPEEFTVESLKEGGLTDQEIAALADGDDPLLTIEAPADSDGEGGDGGDDGEGEAAAIGQPPAGDGGDSAKAAPAQEAAIEPPPEPELPEIPDVKDAEASIAEIDAKLEALAERYDDGDLTRAEFLAQQKELAREQAKAAAQIEAAQLAMQQAEEAIKSHWQGTLAAYKELAPGLWAEGHVQRWDHHLRAVTGSPAYADLTRLQQIQLAHANYAAEVQTRTGNPLDGDAAIPSARKAADTTRKLAPRTDERPAAPTTLAGYNSDGTSEIEDSTFAMVDKEIMKDPLRAEQMFARMTDEQRERYLTEV